MRREVFEALQTPGGKKDKKHKILFAHPGKHAHHSATHKPKHRPDENWQSSLMKNLVPSAGFPAARWQVSQMPVEKRRIEAPPRKYKGDFLFLAILLKQNLHPLEAAV